MEKGIKVRTATWQRISSSALPMRAKATGQYINSIAAKLEALEAGADEALMLNGDGMVAEGSGENLFAAKDGALYTPPLESGILEGITRDCILKIAKSAGIPAFEAGMTRDFLYCSDEAFFTGTAAEVTPIRQVDGIAIGEGARGPLTKSLQETYLSIARGTADAPRSENWLEYV
jgi:branched-chain amino acid aminotransferase